MRWIFLFAGLACAQTSPELMKRPLRAERVHDFDVLHYRIQLSLGKRAFTGETAVRFASLRDGLDRIELDAETFRVTAVRGLRFRQTPGKLTVELGRPLRKGEEAEITIAYRARNVAIDPRRFGMPAGYGLGIAFKPATAKRPEIIHTLSFPEGARHWFPCYDHPSDKATAEINVRSRYPVVSNGVRVAESHWKQEKPHSTYLFMFASGRYQQIVDRGGALPVSYWVYPGDASVNDFGRTREMIAYYEREFDAPFPWAKYDQVLLPDFGGGAESTSATVLDDGFVHDARAHLDFSREWIVAHEIAHQWWGDLVTMRDWPHTWINESFATFYEYVWARATQSADEAAWNLEQKRRVYLKEAREKYLRPIVFDRWEHPNQNFDRHTYQKGAAVLAMLEWQLGAESFRKGIRHFLRKHAYANADTRDLAAAFREATGRSVDAFFEQWVYRAGHPRIRVSWDWVDGRVLLHVEQTPVFTTPVEVGITTIEGKRTHRIHLTRASEDFAFESPSRPLLVRFDEGNRLLMELDEPRKTGAEWAYQLTHDDAVGRIRAAEHIRADAALKDPFAPVRRQAIQSLPASAESAFLEALNDTDPAVRRVALSRLGRPNAPDLVERLKRHFAAERSYLAQAETLRAIGRCGTAKDFLKKAAALASHQDVLRKAALEALKN